MDTSSPLTGSGPVPWTVLRGPATPERLRKIAQQIADQHHLTAEPGSDTVRLTSPNGARLHLRWKPLAPQPPRTLGHQTPPPPSLEVLIDAEPGADAEILGELHTHLADALLPYTPSELATITSAMPLVHRYSEPDRAFDGWALLFRDHYLEHSVGFLLGMERAGIPTAWIYALDKGDRTAGRDHIHATLRARGYRTGLLDNTAINNPKTHADALATATAPIDTFLDAAHAAGRRVLVIDDGGLLACGYGAAAAHRRADAALELTVSGVKRINAAGPLGIPVLNLARSQVKTLLGYREIADSCLRRLRTLLPDRKLIGRPVLLLGYGTLGSRLAAYLRALGCRVTVVDTSLPALIDAAETGFHTHCTAAEALDATRPMLVIGTTGETALTETDLLHLADGTILAPFATRDFSVLTTDPETYDATEIPGVGIRYRLSPSRTVTLLGNGRSANLFEDDSIPPECYDAYRAGTLIAARHLCADPHRVPAGLHTRPADEAITNAGLFEAYYNLYAAPTTH
ncbi:S-adenosyl-L-homocysteine hydrolase, partial [Streptomyces durbertensis]